ncbi:MULTISPECIES: Ger(x)C family spore germination C-terminal domain-containing protein [unclassified Paenibacillus]|uniref:Ger(x)C family spore germination C-terminal domain-containing protein n=1 Tax=unclassified Paenibacillus TaxID=185978 RepID=UPI001AE38671|nr:MULTISPECIES: Ger(x)C family spore germination C-terminal domain-containing protein [unclassified Paenibacillus]MBP1156632.1 hypothetical protein [Paenibacillus sp. PvP091]MBP1172630.1 hypothetical protein [Paenibacillus sp. PvR098]MBP2439010.1 hypothetical protein [Paenibacillus sp. PvP052]
MTNDGLQSGGLRLWLLPLIACLVTGTGCSASPDKGMRPLEYEGVQLTVSGVDEGPGGLRVTTSEHFTRSAEGKLQAYAVAEPRVQSFVSFADAAWQWHQKAPPQLVAIGEVWARAHGFPVSWAKQLQKLGVKQGRKPLVAVVEGSAEQWVRRPGAPEGGITLLSQAGWTGDPLRSFNYGYGDDVVLPYLSAAAVLQRNEGGISNAPQAVVFRNQELVATLSSDQSEWLSCLRGGDLPRLAWPAKVSADFASGRSPELHQVSCSTDIASNGDLKHPRLRISLAIEGRSSGQASADQWEEEMSLQGTELIHSLQELRTDPLRLGEIVRQQYSGIWTQERWREALVRADVTLDVDVTLRGGP